jgi:hypothetical protein
MPLSKPFDYNTTATTPSLELPNCNTTTSTLSLRFPDYNITSANGSKNYMQLHGTRKCKESKYLEISNSLGPLNFININSNSLKQKFHMQKVWRLMCMKRIMQKNDQEVEVDFKVEMVESK